ncbi:MAG: proteasome subunit alpha [Austwickia sp.]|jgi:proteasome alpha subunit|nr:proteasome subunit alpha [Austwickia sp.]MBK8435287.1 proteasome subunit alpha [Austwickia sp.]MBK9101162.1 proteasome subunit alpha [Austwickia sp.]
MSSPGFYVSPDQLIADRAEFARTGIGKGRSVVVCGCAAGVLFVAENPSRMLQKIGEIYDRIGFAGVGKYNEFETLRVAGIRYADLRGYSYDRADVSARALAQMYAQTLAAVFTQASKPFEVELVVGEVGQTPDRDQIYRLGYDGSVTDEPGYVVVGGDWEPLARRMRQEWLPGMTLPAALRVALDVLGTSAPLSPAQVEVALLDRARDRRTFRRLGPDALAGLLIG